MKLKKQSVLSFLIFMAMFFFSALFLYVIEFTGMKHKEMPLICEALKTSMDVEGLQYVLVAKEIQKRGKIFEWLISGEREGEDINPYLQDIKEKYNLVDASVISNATETFYGTNIISKLQKDDELRDGWYYEYRESEPVLKGEVNFYSQWYPEDTLSFYINIPHLSKDGEFLGVSGGSFSTEHFFSEMKRFESAYAVNIYLLRDIDDIIYAPSWNKTFAIPSILSDLEKTGNLEGLYRNKYISSGMLLEEKLPKRDIVYGAFVPNWNAYLVIERSSAQVKKEIMNKVIRFEIPLLGFFVLLYFLFNAFMFMLSKRKTIISTDLSALVGVYKTLNFILWSIRPTSANMESVKKIQGLVAGTILFETIDKKPTNLIEVLQSSLLMRVPSTLDGCIPVHIRFEFDVCVFSNFKFLEDFFFTVGVIIYKNSMPDGMLLVSSHFINKTLALDFVLTEPVLKSLEATSYDDSMLYLNRVGELLHIKVQNLCDRKHKKQLLRFIFYTENLYPIPRTE